MKIVIRFCVIVIGVLVGIGVVSAETLVPTNIITINTNLDNANSDGLCSLREAVANANANDQSGSTSCAAGSSNADTLIFDFAGVPTTITLASALGPINIHGIVIIDGSGEDVTLIPTSSTETLFSPALNSNFTLRGFTIKNADTSANGSVVNIDVGSGNQLFLDEMVFQNNRADRGGVIYALSNTTVQIENSQFIDNAARVTGGALHILTNYHAIVKNTTFSGNTSGVPQFSAPGGAIYFFAIGLANLEIYNSIFTNNQAVGAFGQGGAIRASEGVVIVEDSTFADNQAQEGGAIKLTNTDKFIAINATFSGNSASDQGGALWVESVDGFDKGVDIRYSTFFGNRASEQGQAIYFEDNPAAILMTANIVVKSPGLGFVGNSCYQNQANDVTNTITSMGGNIVDGCAGDLDHASDQDLETFDLFALVDNGGIPAPLTPPKTHAIPNMTSPAYNAKDHCSIDEDQRGAARSNRRCDAGSYEYGSVPTAVVLRKVEISAETHQLLPLIVLSLTLISLTHLITATRLGRTHRAYAVGDEFP